jgi:RNA recognition motif-containing protein
MNIYVGNLSLKVTEAELKQEFMAFGQVVSVSIMNDKYIGSGQPRGYGFVEMASRSEGEAAINGLKGKTLRGRTVCVIEALPLSDSDGTGPVSDRRGGRLGGRRRQRDRTGQHVRHISR